MEISRNPLIEWLNRICGFVIARKKEVFIGAIILVGLLIFSIGYVFYKGRMQERAHKSFVKLLKYYDAGVGAAKSEDILDPELKSFATPEEKWNYVASAFKDAFNANKGAGIAPFFLVYQSDALLNLGKVDEAIDALRYAINGMNKKSAAFSYFKIKLALMLIDTQDQSKVKEGLELLTELSLDSKNSSNDLALYRLGEYYWFAKNYNEAKNYWNQLIVSYGKKSSHPSLWAEKANEKLRLISVK